MGFLTNYKFLAIVEIILSCLVLFPYTFPGAFNHLNITSYEATFNAILGLIAGILLLRRSGHAVLLSKIWSLLQIPYIIIGDNLNIKFAIYFFQGLFFNIPVTHSVARVINPLQPYESYGVNLVGILFFILFLKVKFSKK